MARSIWKGAISFGMVAIPMKLYIATDSKDIGFAQLHESCRSRLKQKRWCPQCEDEVAYGETVRGFEFAKGEYLVMEEEDFESLPLKSAHTIDITRFVDIRTIDPVHYEKSYYIEPESVGAKPFALLKKALETTERAAVAKIALRQKEHLCLIRPYQDGLVMETMFYPDEIRSAAELDFPGEVEVSDAELQMAVMLIDQLTGAFEPQEYRDEYRDALQQVIEAKLGAGAPVSAAPEAPQGKVRDLMEALRASIEAARAQPAPSAAEPVAEEAAAAPKRRARKAS